MTLRDRLEAGLRVRLTERAQRWLLFGAILTIGFITTIIGLDHR